MEEAKKGKFTAKLDGVSLSLFHVNKHAQIHDSLKEDGTTDNPWL